MWLEEATATRAAQESNDETPDPEPDFVALRKELHAKYPTLATAVSLADCLI